ncbi:MAG TPA: MEDS domain-containing protein, partial [Thermoanaerobaculia bacterium]|nr:MEDS domain-containing protein [Thermoanaerobaculia bacterium]
MKGEGGRHGGETPTVDLGIGGQRVPVHSHLAVIWETDEDLRELLGFVTAGLRGEDHCVLVGDRGDHERTLPILKQEGVDIERLMAESRLVVITREPSAQATLSSVTSAFEAAVSAGAPLIRLFGNVGWGRDSGPTDAELFRFEAGLAAVAERFPCIMLCLHPMDALGGAIARNGVLRIHSRLLDEGRIVDSPLFVPPERLAQRIESIASALSRRQGERESGRYLSEILQAIFDNIPVMISFMDASGRFQLVNREWERRLGWSLAEAQQTDLISRLHPDPDRRRSVEEFIRRAEGRWEDFLITTRGGETLETSWFRIALSDGTSIGLGLDVSERQRTEERLNQSAAELRALSERLRVAREEERTSMAREVHDEIGQALTALQMDVDWLEHKVGVLDGEPSGLGAKLRSMSRLIGATLGAVQRIAAELRPGVLDELGLEA